MAENNDSLIQHEKLFFHWILQHPEHFKNVYPRHFENFDIQEIYKVVKRIYIESNREKIASIHEIKIELEFEKSQITVDIIEQVMENGAYKKADAEWLANKFNGWLYQKINFTLIQELLDEAEGIEGDFNLDKNKDFYRNIKKRIDEIDLERPDEEEELFYDFEDAKNHIQPPVDNRIPTGIKTLDEELRGGFPPGTLNIFMGRSNIGKSIFLYNFAANAYLKNYNVCVLSLEMYTPEIMKRLGSMILNVKIDEYDEEAKEIKVIQEKIKKHQSKSTGGLKMIQKNKGKLMVRHIPASKCTPSELKEWIGKIEQKKKIKVNVLILDYMALMRTDEGNSNSTMFEKGKMIAEEVRSVAQEMGICVITVSQINRDKSKDPDEYKTLDMGDIPESKNYADTSDTLWGILQTTDMKQQNYYHIQCIKNRFGRVIPHMIHVNIDYDYLKLTDSKINKED